MAFKITLVSDVRSVLRGTDDVTRALEDVSDSLDDLARDTKQNADKAADGLTREFSDAFDKIKTESRTASRKMGDDFKDGADKAGDGLGDFKDEANSTAREAAASFSGSFEDVADGIQEVLANAFTGFGPAGAAAGLAAAAGIGLVISSLQEGSEAAAEAKQRTLDLADALAEVGNDPSAIRWADELRASMAEITDSKEWFELWQDKPRTRFEEWSAAARKFGVDMADVTRAQTGDAGALARVNAELQRQQDDLRDKYLSSADGQGQLNETYRTGADEIARFQQQVSSGAKTVGDAVRYNRELADAMRDIPDPMARAADASDRFTENLNDNLTVADEGLEQFVKKGRLNLAAWTRELRARAKETKAVQDFSIDVAPKLTPEAMARFAELPTETQALIAKAFRKGDKGDRARIVKNLEAEAKVTKVTLDTSGAKLAAQANPIKIPTSVDNSGAVKGSQDAADTAQRVASRDGNRIEFRTKVNDDGLQSAVNRAAAAINPPTIYVNVKARKDVP